VRDHRRDWLEAIRARRRPACDVAIGCQSTIVSHLGCIVHGTGTALTWDPVQGPFDDDEANRQRDCAMGEPWRLSGRRADPSVEDQRAGKERPKNRH
jgi:hypothetical protein